MWHVTESQPKSLVLKTKPWQWQVLHIGWSCCSMHWLYRTIIIWFSLAPAQPRTHGDQWQDLMSLALQKTLDQASEKALQQASTYQLRTKWWTRLGRFDLYYCRQHASILSDIWILHWIAQHDWHDLHKQLRFPFSKQNASARKWFGRCTFG